MTIEQIKNLLTKEFGIKEPDIPALLSCFGPDWVTQTEDMSISQYMYQFNEKLPDCLKPESFDDHKRTVDLLKRSIFYRGLYDPFVKEELCKTGSNNMTMKQFYDEAVSAEAKKKTLITTNEKCEELAPPSLTTINKTEWLPYNN